VLSPASTSRARPELDLISRFRASAFLVPLALAAGASCSRSPATLGAGVTPSRHHFFPVAAGDHATDCATCHTDPATFAQYSCVGCHAHDQTPTDRVHSAVAQYGYASASCLGCHPSPTRTTYSHTGITGACASCHDVGASFAALPRAGFTHQATNGADCSTCHDTSAWTTASMPGELVHDPNRDLAVGALIPSYVGTSISALTPRTESLSMDMDHATAALDTATRTDCAGCHAGAGAGAYYPGVFHASLAGRSKAQPTACADCHTSALPVGIVGPTATHPARSPASGEMKHDAVEWAGGAPTGTAIVVADCAVCHAPPSATVQATWGTGRSGVGSALFHPSLVTAQLAQPASCLDCHANSRPAAVLTSATATLPAKVTFDHASPAALGECATCHAASGGAGWTSWAGGRFHLAGAASPASCLPCHAGERPTTTAASASARDAASACA